MMNKLFILIMLIPMGLFAQLKVDKTEFDHGLIHSFNNDTAYFTFTNTGIKPIYLLNTAPNDDYAVLVSSKTIAVGESITIGIVYYTDKKGKFNFTVPLYFSHSFTPIELKVKGQIKSINETAFNKCPSIENSKPLQAQQVPISIIVRDAQTLEFLSADVKVKSGRFEYQCVTGYNSKSYKCNCGYGPLIVDVTKKGYQSAKENFVYEPENATLIIDLTKLPQDTIIEPNRDVNTKITKIEPKENKEDTSFTEYVYIPSSVADSGFNSYRYKPNHLIFIIDISGSMKDSTKLYFLKQSMSRLIMTARPQDHITLITYASKVKVVFENYSGADRSAMLKAIDTLVANGGSNGAQSLIMAYDLAQRYFIKGGNNQIFLATDGLFNSSKISDDDLNKLARKNYHSDGIILSSIGFGRDEKALDFLQKLAKNGRGNFLRINNTEGDLDVLLEEVKLQSLSKT